MEMHHLKHVFSQSSVFWHACNESLCSQLHKYEWTLQKYVPEHMPGRCEKGNNRLPKPKITSICCTDEPGTLQ